MEYRKLPHGKEEIGVLGLGMGGIQGSPDEEIEQIVRKAIANGINFFDLCGGAAHVYKPIGKAIKDCRDSVHFQLHLGAVYNKNGEYGWSRDLNRIKKTLLWELNELDTDHIDFGMLHCIDEDSDFDDIKNSGIFDYAKHLKELGIVKHLGFSSHTPPTANRVLDEGIFDIMMFSINAAYDLEKGDEYGIGTTNERAELFRRCEKDGVGISVMKPFHGGKLLDKKSSPFGKGMSREQCIQYALDRPAVLAVVPGVRNMSDLDRLLEYLSATPEQKDYSAIGEFTPANAMGNCVYCNHCQPCPAKIDIGLVNKYYDLALVGDALAKNHYEKLSVKATACLACGHCDKRCPFKVKQQAKMKLIATYFQK